MGCLDCKHYHSFRVRHSKHQPTGIQRKCLKNKTWRMKNWWAKTGHLPYGTDRVPTPHCFESEREPTPELNVQGLISYFTYLSKSDLNV